MSWLLPGSYLVVSDQSQLAVFGLMLRRSSDVLLERGLTEFVSIKAQFTEAMRVLVLKRCWELQKEVPFVSLQNLPNQQL